MSPLSFILFIFAGIAIGFINVTGGGGALITTPLLLALGVSPYFAVATNKFVPIGGFITGSAKYFNAKVFTKNKWLLFMIIVASVSAILGANVILTINATILKYTLLIAASLILLVTVFHKEPTKTKEKVAIKTSTLQKIVDTFLFILVCLYTGSIGIGGGIFFVFIFRHLMNYSYLKSAASMNIVVGVITILATITFAIKGLINYEYGVPLLIGSTIGGFLGAHVAIKKGDALIKIIIVIVAGGLILKTLFS